MPDDNYELQPDYNIDSEVESQKYEDNFVDKQFTSKENGGKKSGTDDSIVSEGADGFNFSELNSYLQKAVSDMRELEGINAKG